MEKGFYARVSRLGSQWLELDLHFLSLGGGEIALGWWFEDCLVPYLVNTSKLEAVQSISIVTGYGKTRSRGARMNDDGMRLRVKAMLKYMNINEKIQPNKGRIHIDKDALIEEVKRNGGRIHFNLAGYTKFKEEETTANKFPDVPQRVRARFRPARPGEGPAGTFIREGDDIEPEPHMEAIPDSRRDNGLRQSDVYQQERRENRRPPYANEEPVARGNWHHEKRPVHNDRYSSERLSSDSEWRGQDRHEQYDEQGRRNRDYDSKWNGDYRDKRQSHSDLGDTRSGYAGQDYRVRDTDIAERRSGPDWERGRAPERERRPVQHGRDRYDSRGENSARFTNRRGPERYDARDTYHGGDRYESHRVIEERLPSRDYEMGGQHVNGDYDMSDPRQERAASSAPTSQFSSHRSNSPFSGERGPKRQRHSLQFGDHTEHADSRQKRASDSLLFTNRGGDMSSEAMKQFAAIREEDPDPFNDDHDDRFQRYDKKRASDGYLKPAVNRGYDVEPTSRGYSIENTFSSKRES